MIKKLLILLLILLLAVYIVLAMSRMSTPPQDVRCAETAILFTEDGKAEFLSRQEVIALLRSKGINPQGQRMCDIDTRLIETTLSRHPLVSHCEAYKTASDKVIIEIRRRTPVLRVLDGQGEDFYVDPEGKTFRIPGTTAAHLPIVTGHIRWQEADSLLRPVAEYLYQGGGWADSISQIHFLPDHTAEIIPTRQDFVIYIGKAHDIRQKMELLAKFSDRALAYIGPDKYSRINLEFNNQIICTHKEKPGIRILSARTAPTPQSIAATAMQAATSEDNPGAQPADSTRQGNRTAHPSARTEKPHKTANGSTSDGSKNKKNKNT